MAEAASHTAPWWRALTLSERAGLFHRLPANRTPDAGNLEALSAWKKQAPFGEGDWLRRRLALEGLDESSFAAVLRVFPELLSRPGEEPPWMARLEEALAARDTSDMPMLEEAMRRDPMGGFLRLVSPLLARGLLALRGALGEARARKLPASLASDTLERELFAALPGRVLSLLDRTLVLELNVARLTGKLEGETPAARFDSFVQGLADSERAMELWREYPVLARLVVEEIERWRAAVLEFLGHLEADWDGVLQTFFDGRDPGPLLELRTGAGDPHRAGRSVHVLRFASGSVVYKPHPMAMDAHFQELLSWIDARGNHPSFRTLKVLPRGDHGWVEWVAAAGCVSQEEVERYHRRLGGLLAIFYALGAVDLHFENLIASGEQPVPIDLETLLHPRLPLRDSARPDERLVAKALGDSVLRIGLLPYRVGDSEEFSGADLSGVARVAGQLSPDAGLAWEASGSDAMHAVRKRLPMSPGSNRPTLAGREVDVTEHLDAVSGGFADLYRLLARHRQELLAEDGVLQRFAADSGRAVLRSTRGYALLLENGFHPDFLRDALDRDRFFDRLWIGVDEIPALQRVIGEEHRDLWAGDVPYFSCRPDSADAWSSTGRRIADFFEEAPLAAARRRIAWMSEEDLKRQRWLARTSLGTLVLNRPEADWKGYTLADPGFPEGGGALCDALLGEAVRLGEWFEEMAFEEGSDLTWVGVDLRNRVWSLFPISEDLYAGTPGIALFLAYLSALCGETRFGSLARRGIDTLLRRLASVEKEITGIGLYQGWGGIVYALAHLGSLWRDERLLAEARRRQSTILERLPADQDLDVVSGAAGAVEGLLALYRASPEQTTLEAALRCGEHLLARAHPTGRGVSWLIRIGGDQLQTGFAHGASGIALALCDLWRASEDVRFRQAAEGAFEFEREHFWPHLSDAGEMGREARMTNDVAAPPEESMAMTWCYGAPGVGLARLGALRSLADARLEEECRRAVALTLMRGFGKNHSLCHGDLGNLDLLQEAGRRDAAGDPAAQVRRLSRSILASVRRDGWLCGTVGGIEAPGLMNGLAGIGYGLLRLADPATVPAVLMMEAPR